MRLLKQGLSLSTRLTIAIVALVLATAGTVGFLSYRNIAAIAVPRALVRLDANARALAVDLSNLVANARADLKGFRHIIGLDEVIALSRDPAAGQTGLSLAQWRGRIAQRLAAELDAKQQYLAFRIIGLADGGRELVRAQRPTAGGAARIVPDAELEQKADRPYFARTMAARDGEVVVSAVELNQENDTIEIPRAPVVRVSTPIFGPDGARFGMLIINVDMRSAFKRLDEETSLDAATYVVNERGDYLSHPDNSREFGFAFGKSYRIQDDYPGLARAVATGEQQPDLFESREGKRFGVAFVSVRLADGPRVSVAEAIPEDKIVGAALTALRDSSLIGGAIAVLGAVLLAVAFARSLVRPLSQMTTAVAGFSQGAPLLVPLEAKGEIGILARAFEKMAREVRERTSAMQHDREVFESIMATMAEAVLLVDMDGTVVYENTAATAILTSPIPGERPSWTAAFEAFYPDGMTPLPPEQWPSRRSLRGETVDGFEVCFRPHGVDKLKHLLCGARPIRNAAGKQTGSVVVFRDVTEAKETERQLHQSQKLDAIGQLTGGIAHDFNNMLTVITGSSEILLEELTDRPTLLTIAGMIVEAADRGAELTKHLLAFARKQPLQPRNIDVNTMVLDTVKLLRPSLGEQIEIETTLEQDAQPALIDPSQLSAALLNLAVNARDAMPNGGKLLLETGNVVLDDSYAQNNVEVVPGPYVMIAVSDTGVGIPASLRDKVFEPFFTTKEVGRGTGLGLSMVYGFVKQSNGHIKIYSEEGYGTTIKLYLPCASTESQAAEIAAPIEGGSETILVVEDDPLVSGFVVTQLHSLGYRTLMASSGTAALAQVDGGAAFDLLFTDVIMPGGMNGRQLADAVTQRRPHMKVLYTSGYTENAIVHHGRLDADVLLLPKPYRKSELARMVRLALTPAPAAASGEAANARGQAG
ncbi:ATP-binding protein [Rhodopseudomonas sp. P2A-2r]|uniref:ATP-binding protein n=1 Tax=unclassified Rhodopseudomonas TaxID=2638247 RepID=UPI0022347FA2|nr:ATP-binding protein [Rhodopseudomonas sp. P2A-2r]UZE47750.1 ATP-binding protein [Rhodopseudomonas sp. P2A-2r]